MAAKSDSSKSFEECRLSSSIALRMVVRWLTRPPDHDHDHDHDPAAAVDSDACSDWDVSCYPLLSLLILQLLLTLTTSCLW